MSQLLTLLLIVILTFTSIVPVSLALKYGENTAIESSEKLIFPKGDDFVQLKSLIDSTFSVSDSPQRYRSNCIYSGKLCSNYRYTSIVEKAIKLIILKTYTGNEEFYRTLFGKTSSYDSNDTNTVKSIIDNVPRGSTFTDWKKLGFGPSIGGQLLDASFGVNFTENANSSSMLGAIERKIQDMKRDKCQKEDRSGNSYEACPWNGEISNIYLPTQQELYKETIFLNGNSVRIETLKDEIEYKVDYKFGVVPYATENSTVPLANLLSIIPVDNIHYSEVIGRINDIKVSRDRTKIGTHAEYIMDLFDNDVSITPSLKLDIEEKLMYLISNISLDIYKTTKFPNSYILQYKKNSYTLEEAKATILEKNTISINTVSNSSTRIQLPCQSSNDFQVQKECETAMKNYRDVSSALVAYFSDRETYPDSVDKLDRLYLPKGRGDFDQYFAYKSITNADNYPDYEITYIGNIGEDTEPSSTGPLKRDYLALMSGSTVPEIPSIFVHIPSDSMVLYVRNPANLLDILNQKSNTSQKLSGFDVSESIRMFIRTFFEIDDFEQIEKNLKHEMAIVVNNLDATAPDIVVILSEADKNALSPTATARVVGSRDGFIFVASSKASLERFTDLTIEKSLKDAPDFKYVWWKQSTLIKDALVYVGDEFFANLLTLETYLTHYRKYRDYARLTSLQELVWAYSDAFGKSPTDFTELSKLGLSTLTGNTLSEFSIADGLVKHKYIGTLKSINTIPESGYNLSKISRSEIEDYKFSVLKYRDVWQNALDPMGIVLNRYGDGLEMDFFMTPIPSFPDRDMQELQKIVEGFAKDSLSFTTNPHIRIGLASFVWGIDLQKIEKIIQDRSEIREGSEEFSREVLDGKNIFDYIAGEFAFSVGDIDPDMLDGWNIEKIDIYGSIQMTSEEKGKELIEIIRSRILREVGSERGDEAEMIKGFLAKPLIEDYNGKKIYYVEGLPIPFVGKIGFTYTFVDDFFIIGLNRSTIKKVIDTAKTGDENKAKILDNSSFSTGTFFAAMMDGVTLSERIKNLYEKNKSSIPRYMKYLELADLSSDSGIDSLIGVYYSTQDRNKRLGIQTKPFSYTLGTLQVTGDTEKIMVKVDAGGIKNLSGVTLQMWNNIESEPNFSKSMFSDGGIPLAEFLALPYIEDIISLNIIAHLDQITSGTESLFRNMTFGLNIGDDEIGFRFRVFREMDQTGQSNSFKTVSKDILIIIFIVVLLGISGGLGYIFYKRKKSQSIPPSSPYSAPIITQMNPGSSGDNPLIINTSTAQNPVVQTFPTHSPAGTPENS